MLLILAYFKNLASQPANKGIYVCQFLRIFLQNLDRQVSLSNSFFTKIEDRSKFLKTSAAGWISLLEFRFL